MTPNIRFPSNPFLLLLMKSFIMHCSAKTRDPLLYGVLNDDIIQHAIKHVIMKICMSMKLNDALENGLMKASIQRFQPCNCRARSMQQNC